MNCLNLFNKVLNNLKFNLHNRLISKGVKFQKRHLETIDTFISTTNYDVIFNCLGLGAFQFCNDQQIIPIRGQMIRVKAPWIKHFYYTDDNCYIIPK